MPFRLHGVAAAFQRLVDQALRVCEAFANAYLSDIISSSSFCQEHLQHLHQVLDALDKVGLEK